MPTHAPDIILDEPARRRLHASALQRYNAFKQRNLLIDITRGRPSAEQLQMVSQLLELPGENAFLSQAGTDCRNYGGERELWEARELMSWLTDVPPANTLVEGSSSLALMHDCLAYCFLKGCADGCTPWCRLDKVRFICPVPGYDYHQLMTAEFGIDMIPVAMTPHGPDMDAVEAIVRDDDAVKGIWCVPKYSNPTGAIYDDLTVQRIARMQTAARDFRIFWDNAYAVHHLTIEHVTIANLLDACVAAGNPDRAFIFASTSKVTFPGSGLAAFAGSDANVRWFSDRIARRAIMPDRINQLRHAMLLPDIDALHQLMERHRQLLAPKFDAVLDTFGQLLDGTGFATWTRPKGGYFISLFVAPGHAKRTIELAREMGVAVTPAGSGFPQNNDPDDTHIRVAPTSITADDARLAASVVATAVILACTGQ